MADTPSKDVADPAQTGDAPQAFDDLLDRLRALVDRLESGNLTLEDSLRCFEQGMQLCRKGGAILDGAERRVETLLVRPGADVQTVPFENENGTRGREGQD